MFKGPLGRCVVGTWVILFGVAGPAVSENWPTWRGPAGDNVSHESSAPLTWSRDQNVRWKVELPEPGNSTPIAWGDRVFVTQPIAAENRRTLMCFHRSDGKLLWQAGTTYTADEPTHPTNPFCSASPVTDGQCVIAWFGSAGLFCWDMEGRELWRRDLGVQEHEWGYAASPVLHGNLCFLNFGPGTREFVVALDKQTGRDVWRYDVSLPPAVDAPEVEKTPQQRDAELRGSWSTPLVIREEGRDALIVTLPGRVVAFAPQSGRILWTCDGLGTLVYASPMVGEGMLVALGGYHRASLAVRTGGSGDVTETHRVWHEPRTKLRLGTGVVHKGHLYITDMEGIAQCLDLATNKVVWQERLTGDAGDSATWSSLVLTADERLYLLNQAGDTFVFAARPEFELLATNSLAERTNATTVISDRQIFIRTHEHLWCIEAP